MAVFTNKKPTFHEDKLYDPKHLQIWVRTRKLGDVWQWEPYFDVYAADTDKGELYIYLIEPGNTHRGKVLEGDIATATIKNVGFVVLDNRNGFLIDAYFPSEKPKNPNLLNKIHRQEQKIAALERKLSIMRQKYLEKRDALNDLRRIVKKRCLVAPKTAKERLYLAFNLITNRLYLNRPNDS